jgi:hypothetical protein
MVFMSDNCNMKNPLYSILFASLLVMTGCGHDVHGDGYWGDSSNMLRLHIEVTKRASNQHWVSVVFQNISKEQMRIWESGFWPNTMLQCFDDSGRNAETTIEGINLLKSFTPGGSRDKNYLVSLAPNQTHRSDPVLLERVFKLHSPKTYHVRVIYEERWAGGWTGSVTSNVVDVKVD